MARNRSSAEQVGFEAESAAVRALDEHRGHFVQNWPVIQSWYGINERALGVGAIFGVDEGRLCALKDSAEQAREEERNYRVLAAEAGDREAQARQRADQAGLERRYAENMTNEKRKRYEAKARQWAVKAQDCDRQVDRELGLHNPHMRKFVYFLYLLEQAGVPIAEIYKLMPTNSPTDEDPATVLFMMMEEELMKAGLTGDTLEEATVENGVHFMVTSDSRDFKRAPISVSGLILGITANTLLAHFPLLSGLTTASPHQEISHALHGESAETLLALLEALHYEADHEPLNSLPGQRAAFQRFVEAIEEIVQHKFVKEITEKTAPQHTAAQAGKKYKSTEVIFAEAMQKYHVQRGRAAHNINPVIARLKTQQREGEVGEPKGVVSVIAKFIGDMIAALLAAKMTHKPAGAPKAAAAAKGAAKAQPRRGKAGRSHIPSASASH